jgi:hypothetical protein
MPPRLLGLGTLDEGAWPALRPALFSLEETAAVHVREEAKGVPGLAWTEW